MIHHRGTFQRQNQQDVGLALWVGQYFACEKQNGLRQFPEIVNNDHDFLSTLHSDLVLWVFFVSICLLCIPYAEAFTLSGFILCVMSFSPIYSFQIY